MSRFDLLDEQEMAGLTGEGVVVPPGYAVPPAAAIAGAVADPGAATAGALPADQTPKVVTDQAGQQVLQTDALDPSLPTAAPEQPRTGAEATLNYQSDDSNRLLKSDERQQAGKTLLDFGLGKDEGGGAAGGGGGGHVGLPAWYRNAKLRGDRIPGTKNEHYVLDEATWEPPKEQKLLKGLAGMLGNMTTAGSQVAVKDENRPLAMRMKDARRIALGQGATQLAETFLDRKNLRYQDLLKTAKEESEIEKNRQTGTGKGAGGGATVGQRMTALSSVLGADTTGATNQRLEKDSVSKAQQQIIDNDPKHPKAEKLRQAYLEEAAGWLKDTDIPHASYAELLAMRPQIGAAIDRAHKSDDARIAREWEAWKMTHVANQANMDKWKAEVREMENRRRDFFLEDGMFWKHGVPPKETKEYEDIRSYIQINNQILYGLSQLADIQRQLQERGPLYGAGGEVIKNLGRFIGMDQAQSLAMTGFQWASELRDLIRKKNNFGVPQAWEQELLRTRVLEPGSILAWLQGTKNFDSLYELHKVSGRQWLRDKGRIGFTDEESPGEQWTGTAPARLSEPVVRDRNGKPIQGWDEIKDVGKDVIEQLEKPGGRRLSPEEVKVQQAADAAALKEKYGQIDSLGEHPEAEHPIPAETKAGHTEVKFEPDNGMSPHFKAFAMAVQHAVDTGVKWTAKQAAEWKARADKTDDPIFKRIASLPFEAQQAIFENNKPYNFSTKPGGDLKPAAMTIDVSAEPAPAKAKPGGTNLPDKKPVRYKVVDGKGQTLFDIPAGKSKADADKILQNGIKIKEGKKEDTTGIRLVEVP